MIEHCGGGRLGCSPGDNNVLSVEHFSLLPTPQNIFGGALRNVTHVQDKD